MAELIYTPKNIKDPKNHPRRIFFSCHPDDTHLFEKIEQDIRSIESDVVIARADSSRAESDDINGTSRDGSYDDSYDGSYDDSYIEELGDFHLSVIAVTENWLSSESPSFLSEFPFLREHRRAVLPIVFDDGAAEPFRQKCPKIQYLRASDSDYSEKLRRTLSDVLFSSETVEKIKGVFPYSMFISYCREDRECVTDLIRRIHSSETGRRVSVWYDKYLPMGKDFEESIFDRVDDCSIFAVTLTSNLVGRPNYVEKKEYPHAKTKNKKIVFFEALPTDREKMSVFDGHEKYPLIGYENDGQFSAELKRFLKSVPKNKSGERLSAPESDYYMALAYLNGIFVEFDGDYAVEKLEKSANLDYLPAAEQLATAYAYGIGVPRDAEKAVYWSNKAVEITEKGYSKALDNYYLLYSNKAQKVSSALEERVRRVIDELQDNTLGYVIQLGRSGHLLRDEGYVKEACDRFQTAIDVLEQVNSLNKSFSFGKSLVLRYENELMRTRHAHRLQGTDKAKQVYEHSLAEYLNDPEDKFCINAVISNAQMYAMELLQGGEKEDAEAAARVLEGVFPIAEAHSGIKEVYELLLLLCRDMGRCLTVKEDYEGARKYIANGIRLYESLPAESAGNVYIKLYLPQMMFFCGETYFFEENLNESVRWHTYAFYALMKAEEEMGQTASYADMPVSLLQTYAVIIDRLAIYVHPEGSSLVALILEKIDHYTRLTYSEDHQKQAQRYIEMMEGSRRELLG